MVSMRSRTFVRGTALLAAAVFSIGLAGCAPQQSASSSKPDDGSKLTMWARSDGLVTKALVDAYNWSHKNGVVDFGAMQAGVVIAVAPTLIVYLLLQRYYVAGLTNGALRG